MLDHLEKLIGARSIDGLWAAFSAAMNDYGFDRVVYASTNFSTAQDYGALDDILVLTNHSDSYIKGFIGERLFERGPMIRWFKSNTGACLWSWIHEEERQGRLTQSEAEVVRFNLSHGVRAGVSINFPDTRRNTAAGIALCAQASLSQEEVDQLWALRGREILMLNSVFHIQTSTMPNPTDRRQLTDRQKEALEWVGEGKTAAAIATIMGVAPATVEKHLRLAREALNVETTAQAVLKASMQKHIFSIPITSRCSPAPTPKAVTAIALRYATTMEESQSTPANTNTPARRNEATKLSLE